MTVDAGSDVAIEGGAAVATYASSDWAERSFCSRCGTHLFYRLKSQGTHYVPVGLLEGVDDLRFHMQIFVDRKPPNYAFANETARMTEAEVFAKFAGAQ